MPLEWSVSVKQQQQMASVDFTSKGLDTAERNFEVHNKELLWSSVALRNGDKS